MEQRSEAILGEFGFKAIWRLRGREHDEAEVFTPAVAEHAPAPAAAAPGAEGLRPVSEALARSPAASASAAAVREQLQRLREGGPAKAPTPEPADAGQTAPVAALTDAAGLDWAGLEQAVAACKACRLCESRRQPVLGVGDREADWLILGEGPGGEEEACGEPFVGPQGKLLDAMLAALGLARGEDVYIANAVKCRPPRDRTPEADEMACCQPWLARQVALVRPKLILALGRPAAQALTGGEIRIAQARTQQWSYQGIPVLVSYHPAYLLRNPADKARAWEDLCRAEALMLRLKDEAQH